MADAGKAGAAPRWRRCALYALAAVYAAFILTYSVLWMLTFRPSRLPVELGYGSDFRAARRALVVNSVQTNGPAERAGLRPGDRIVAVNGVRIENESSTDAIWTRSKPGDAVELTIERPGEAAPIVLHAVFRARHREGPALAGRIATTYPVPFVLVGLAALFLRIEDPHVWLLALLFGSFPSSPGFPSGLSAVPATAREFLITGRNLLVSVFGPLFYSFFAVFPARSPMDRRWPWLKWAALPAGLSLAIPPWRASGLRPLPPLPVLLGEAVARRIPFLFVVGLLALGLVSLGTNFFGNPDEQARRKIRVMFWATLVGMIPGSVHAGLVNLTNLQPPPWLSVVAVMFSFLVPLGFAYAVVKHRVLDIPLLLKRSARYLMVQRGFTFLLSGLSLALMLVLARLAPAEAPLGVALGAVFGVTLFWGGSRLHQKVSAKIDRVFFRGAYDARLLLEDLAEKSRTTTARDELAQLLYRHLNEALHPSFLFVYLRDGEGRLVAEAGDAPRELEQLPADRRPRDAAASSACIWEIPEGAAEDSVFSSLHPECAVQMLGSDGALAGLLVLGARLSEEPYSGEDKRLLASVASQAGTALDNIRLGEQIAAKIEAERRTAREMEIARQVQLRLLPQRTPELRTLEVAARCIQARSVGGDYYDFLDFGESRAGLVLADVSGKGVHAALLVANLQASLRSLAAAMTDDPARMLEQVNRTLWSSTAAQHYATMFFAIYNDAVRELIYSNCGHNPPMLVRQGGAVERLEATATVVGLFERWICDTGRVRMAPGDLLAVFSDGVSEAMRGEEEFGEARLLEALRSEIGRPAGEMVERILAQVQEFSAGVLSDDLTLLIARARPVH